MGGFVTLRRFAKTPTMVTMTATLLTSLLLGSIARAAPVLDQSNVFGPSTVGSIAWREVSASFDEAQTITVGLAGKLTKIDLELDRYVNTVLPITIDLRVTNASNRPVEPDSPVLASFALTPAAVPVFPQPISFPYTGQFLSLDLSAFNVTVAPGNVLAIAARSDSPLSGISVGYLWRISEPQGSGIYPGGSAYTRTTGNWFQVGTSDDFVFRTYVDNVPEPAAAAAMTTGLTLAAMFIVRRGRSRLA